MTYQILTNGDDNNATSSTSGFITVVGVFTYNDSLKIKVPEGKLEDYKTVEGNINGRTYSAARLWFDGGEDYMLEAFYE